jgi:DNA (cytosine-5)-methyltransferase 1
MARYQISIFDPMIIDYFAGGGGASTGIELAFGRPVDLAVNHDPAAIQLHEINHPFTKHLTESVFDVDLKRECQGRHVAFMWLSPDCTHFSVARGGTPVKKEIRGLAWIAVRAAHDVQPDVIMLENVKEILTWGRVRAKRDSETGRVIKVDGSIAEKGKTIPSSEQAMEPDPNDKGKLWTRFVNTLRILGYEVEWRVLKGCDYGAPTTRERLFMIARRDGYPIVWADPTHGDPNSEEVKRGEKKPWRTAAECIDFSKYTPSIFERKKPLAENTLKRIVRGLDKFVIKSSKPFIIPTGYGERKGQSPRVNNIFNPPLDTSKTITTQTNHNPLYSVTLFSIGQTGGGDRIRSVDTPHNTFVSKAESCMSIGVLSKAYGGNYKGAGSKLSDPLHTITAQDHNGLVAAHITKYYNGSEHNADIGSPLPTITAKDRMALTTSNLMILRQNQDFKALSEPMLTITARAGHMCECRTIFAQYIDNGKMGYWGKIRELLNKYGGYELKEDEIILFEIEGEYYFLSDIGMRMLDPEELKLAQGFPKDYILDHDKDGKPYPKTEQVAKIGNSVCPQIVTALCRANRPDLAEENILKTMADLTQKIAICV